MLPIDKVAWDSDPVRKKRLLPVTSLSWWNMARLRETYQLRIHGLICTTLVVMVGTNWLCGLAGADEVRPRIAWYGTLESGLTAAKRTGRPILLVSGAPHCHGVSGIW